MRYSKYLALVMLLGTVLSGCIEDVAPGSNQRPRVWFTRAPREQQVLRQNNFIFEWMATDVDDDLGMGQTYVRLDPSVIDSVRFHTEGWVRVYDLNPVPTHDIIDLPDSDFVFRVKVVDGRGGVGGDSVKFTVRFDNVPPTIDSVKCPGKLAGDFKWVFRIYAHDEARSPRSRTPTDSLKYWYRLAGTGTASGARSYEAASYEVGNRVFEVDIKGQEFPGIYRFRAKALDLADNYSAEFVCEFEVRRP